MAPFKNNICYYYNGKIYNQENDPVLKKIKLVSVVNRLQESADHNIAFVSEKDLIILRADTLVNVFSDYLEKHNFSLLRPNPLGKGFQLNLEDSCFIITDGVIKDVSCTTVGKDVVTNKDLQQFRNSLKITAEDFTPGVNNVLFSSTYDGTWMVDTTTFDHYEELFLKGKQTSHALVDNEKNIWFTTLGDGVYKLASREFKTYYFKKNQTSEIFSLTKIKDKLYAGTGFGRVYVQHGAVIDTLNFQKDYEHSLNFNSTLRVTCLKQIKDGTLSQSTSWRMACCWWVPAEGPCW
jgi:hypothetical protein